jgi:hypothetical protein
MTERRSTIAGNGSLTIHESNAIQDGIQHAEGGGDALGASVMSSFCY